MSEPAESTAEATEEVTTKEPEAATKDATVGEAKEGAAKEEKKQPQAVVRREIRYAGPELQERFAAAIAKMQENTTPGENSSEFFRLAGYHGWPGKYCSHGREDFPTWHRAYLAEFERSLGAADKANGHDGTLGLPYWDWTDLVGPDGKEPFPRILDDPRLAQLPKDFFQQPPSGRGTVLLKPFKRRPKIAQQLQNASVAKVAAEALLAIGYAQFASTKGGQVSIEDSHNSVHVAVGFPMSAVDSAAFDPTFWLHHCNIDRYWQRYLEDHKDSLGEAAFLGKHEHEVDPDQPNRFLIPFAPFQHPKTGHPFQPSEAFTLDGLDYCYDKLPQVPDVSHMLREMPSYAVFQKIRITDLQLETYSLHVFVVNKDFPAPDVTMDPDTFHTLPNYAGFAGIFGGKDGCETCLARLPFDVRVDLTTALNQTNLSRYDVELFTIAVDSMGDSHALSATPVPAPVIQGPLFEKVNTEEKETAQGAINGDVKALQTFLLFHGFLQDPVLDVDGWFGPLTVVAVKEYQASVGLPPTGVLDAATKRAMAAPKMDQKSYAKPAATREKGISLTYWVGESPAQLNREQVLKDIQEAFELWTPLTGITWTRVAGDKATDYKVWTDCDVEVLWHDQHYHSELRRRNKEYVKLNQGDRDNLEIEFNFDGPGGQLGHSGFDFIHLDQNEIWLTRDLPKTQRTHWYIFNVVAHELGHLLGLEHSRDPNALMASFYDDSHRSLTDDDRQAFNALY